MLRVKAQYKISIGGSKMLDRLFGNDAMSRSMVDNIYSYYS